MKIGRMHYAMMNHGKHVQADVLVGFRQLMDMNEVACCH
jgi:hypothetical protein